MSPEDAPTALRLGTRRSAMAMSQSTIVAEAITESTGRPVELVGITTHGDVSTEHLTQIGGTGVFVSALRERLLDGTVDLAVHSLKDLPTAAPEQIALAAVPVRDDPRDVLISQCGRKLADLPSGARVGTGSPRRISQLRLLRPDLDYVPIRGNGDTRIGKVMSGELDAVVLAYAGLGRLNRLDDICEAFTPDDVLPAPGQGAIAVECRADRIDVLDLVATVDDGASRAAVAAERAVLATLEAGCHAPVGAYATLDGTRLHLTATVVADDGTALRMSTSGPVSGAAELGRTLAGRMLADGAATLMREPER
ncbi:MAG TPA: hydroxymethylbilane synthase [Streptosporangiaceae bacterium]